MLDVNANGQLVITSTTATAEAIREAIEGCDGVQSIDTRDPEEIDFQAVLDEEPPETDQ